MISNLGMSVRRDVLGSLAVAHLWSGQFDVHHIAWPEAEYKRVNAATGSHTGGLYRGAAALKVRMPRQLNNYIHAVSEPPKLPDVDTMRQWTIEQRQIDRLYDTVRRQNMADFDMSEEQREKYCFSNFQHKLEEMDEGPLGLMPEKEYLAELDITQARQTLRALARVRGISNAKSSQQVFSDSRRSCYKMNAMFPYDHRKSILRKINLIERSWSDDRKRC